MSVSFGSKTTKQKQTSESDPWDVAMPYLKDFLPRLGEAGQPLGALSETQTDMFSQLQDNAAGGNPYAGDMDALARQLFATPDRTGDVSGAFDTLNRRLSPTADGANLDLNSNPFLQQAMQFTTDDVMNRVNSQFAGAGRDLSGMHQGAIGRGVAGVQLPLFADLYSREQGRTDAAGRDLFAAETGTATTNAGLDAARADLQHAGIGVGQSAIDAGNYGPERILQLEQAMRSLPVDELSRLAEILFAAGGLGQQSTGTGKATQTGFGATAKLI